MTAANRTDATLRALRPAIERMPDPTGREQAAALETELAAAFGVQYAITVSSGTAALHIALLACGIGPGDEVLVPALTVVMTVAAVAAAGAHPVFVDTDAESQAMDPDDLASKITPRSRAVIPVHLAGRCGSPAALPAIASATGLRIIEDACQAQGSRYRGRHAGTSGDIGCYSLKDGKILASGEGGYLLTNDPELAGRAAGWRSHWQTGTGDIAPGSRLGHNYRLAEPLAALARHNLTIFNTALARRREQDRLLYHLVGTTPGFAPLPPCASEVPNGYSALWRLNLPNPRAFCAHLARNQVTNSVGSFGLRAAHQHPACRRFNPAECPRAARHIDSLLAVTLHAGDSDDHLHRLAATITREARAWTAC